MNRPPRLLWLACLALLVTQRLDAQESGQTQSRVLEVPPQEWGPDEFEHLVLWRQTDDNNIAGVDGIGLSERDIGDGVGSAAEKALTDWMSVLLKKFDTFVQPIDARANPREQAYTMLNSLVGAGFMGSAGLVLGGAGLGAAAGIAIGTGSSGAAAGIGVAVFAGGTAAGITAGGANIGVTMIAALVMANEIEKRFPYKEYGDPTISDRGLSEDGDSGQVEAYLSNFPEWVLEDLRAVSALQTTEDSVTERSMTDFARGTAQRFAGPQESLFIHVVADLLGPNMQTLATKFADAPGLSRGQRTLLAEHGRTLQKIFSQLEYIRRHHRLSPTAPPAMPLATWQKALRTTIQGNTKLIEQAILDSFSIPNTRIEVNSKRVSWTTPRALREHGAPDALSLPIRGVDVDVKSPLGRLTADIVPGQFEIAMGGARIDDSCLRIDFSIMSRTSLARVAVTARPAIGPVGKFEFSPRLQTALTGSLTLVASGTGLRVNGVKLGKLRLELGTPKLPGLDGLLSALENAVSAEIGKLLGSHLGWGELFDGIDKFTSQRLLTTLNGMTDQLGVSRVSGLRRVRFDGKNVILDVDVLSWSGLPKIDSGHVRRAVQVFK